MFVELFHKRKLSISKSLLAFIALATVAVWVGASAAQADMAGQVRSAVASAKLGKTRVGIYIYDLDRKEVLASINPDEPMIPASNMKLLTSAAALDTLGPDFTFQTQLRLLPAEAGSGEPLPSLLVVGDGDPAFGDPNILKKHGLDAEKLLTAWVQAVQATGQTHFAKLVMDDRIFDQDFVHDSWPKDQLNRWYCAQVAGINFNDNCIDLYPQPTVAGQNAQVKIWPAVPSINLTNQTVTGNANTFWVARKEGTNDLTFYGKVKSRYEEPVNVTMNDPPMLFGALLQYRLKQAGVIVDQVVRPAPDAKLPASRALHIVQTTIDQVLDRCNKDSQNLFAECLFRRLGHQVSGQPAGWDNSAAAVRAFVNRHLGALSDSLTIADGSGMSRLNHVTAKSLVGVMLVMMQDPKKAEVYIQSLSIGGVDGTLERRFRDLKGVVIRGKSGYISKVATLTGLILVPDASLPAGRRTVAFSLLFNDFAPPVYLGTVHQLQDQIVEMVAKQVKASVQTASLP